MGFGAAAGGAAVISVLAALLAGCTTAAAARAAHDPNQAISRALQRGTATVQTLKFGGKGGAVVRVMRGRSALPRSAKRAPVAARRAAVFAPSAAASALPAVGSVEIISFSDGSGDTVRVVRGVPPAPGPVPIQAVGAVQTVRFADPRLRPITIVRGSPPPNALALFAPASGSVLDRVAFAVDGAESSHGADLRMWRPEPAGPQGPMQVTAAAAFDVGGGDRFDIGENRVLGRAYLASMYERYGNWPDAIAAYNWGPGNIDAWIAAGRDPLRLPLEVEHYVTRVLRDALIADRGGALLTPTAGRLITVPAL